ncbi:MAG: TlpA disulfide reductase family protein [Gammaproteobacteria bacterium]|nr:TlpA disulfide reductase family protein [Gammaproteobacteria bacterium]
MRALLFSLILSLSILFIDAASAVSEGDLAPDFTLPTLNGQESKSLSASQGKIRYLDFWASWCIACRVSIPDMIVLQQELGKERFKVIAISVDEWIDDATKFLSRYSMNYDNLSDPQGEIAEAYGLLAMPTSFVIDPEGWITLVHQGFKPGDMTAIRAHIDELLSLQPAEER